MAIFDIAINLKFGLVHHFTKLGSGEYYLEELETEVQVTSALDCYQYFKKGECPS